MPVPLVLSLGETLIDLIASDGATELEEVSAFVARPGGAPANAAVSVARMGLPAGFCGVIGNDPFGAKLRMTLKADRVDTSRLRGTNDADTTIAFAWKNARGDGNFRLVRMADRLLDLPDIAAAEIANCAAIIVGSVALSAEPSRGAITEAVRLAADAGVPVCFDVNVRPTLWRDIQDAVEACHPILERTTLLKISLDDAKFLFGSDTSPDQALVDGLATRARFVVLTDGGRGAWFANAGDDERAEQFVPAFSVEAIDPTGAGDAFTGAIISRLIANGWRRLMADDVRFASAAGALTTTRRGAIEALPTRAEIDHFLQTR